MNTNILNFEYFVGINWEWEKIINISKFFYLPLKNFNANVYNSFNGKPHFSTMSSSLVLLHIVEVELYDGMAES